MRIVTNGHEQFDAWRLTGDDEAAVAGQSLLPLARWLEISPSTDASPFGLLVRAGDELAGILAVTSRCPLVAVEFASFTDGRGYSQAQQVRAAGYAGDLRAVGDVLRDQAFYLLRCGFTSFAPAAHVSSAEFIAGLADFSLVYQPAADGLRIVQRLRAGR